MTLARKYVSVNSIPIDNNKHHCRDLNDLFKISDWPLDRPGSWSCSGSNLKALLRLLFKMQASAGVHSATPAPWSSLANSIYIARNGKSHTIGEVIIPQAINEMIENALTIRKHF